MASTLEFYPLPTQTFPLTGNEYTIRNIGRYLQNPVDVTLSAQGFGGIDARINANNLIISESGVLSEQPFVVLTATRGTEVVKRIMDLVFTRASSPADQPSAAVHPSAGCAAFCSCAAQVMMFNLLQQLSLL